MKASGFPAFVQSLPEADLPFHGLRGWFLQSESGQVLFNESDIELTVPEHMHGNQWGVVIDGKIDLTIGDQTQTYTRGDSYFIPAGTPHQARIYPGYRAVDYFADRDRYRTRSHGAYGAFAVRFCPAKCLRHFASTRKVALQVGNTFRATRLNPTVMPPVA